MDNRYLMCHFEREISVIGNRELLLFDVQVFDDRRACHFKQNEKSLFSEISRTAKNDT